MLHISPTAAKEIKRIKFNSKKPDSSLRLAVKSGGCSGLFYNLALEEIVHVQQSDHTSDSPRDRLLEIDEIKIVIDTESWKYIKNLKLDYSEDLMGGGFRFHNPQVKNVCGCGISFAKAE